MFLVDFDDTLFEEEIKMGNEYVYLRLEYNDGWRCLILAENK